MNFVVEGIVVEGDHRGRQLGYPTANVQDLPDIQLPDDGVYAGTVERASGEIFLSAISVGTRATFYGSEGVRLVEAFLLDFDADLYGERLKVTMLELIRTQRKFDGVDELIEQIRADVEETRRLLESKELTRLN
ncbi:MAG TPA: riboflavin kinase [Acidimicrobiales bacterium]|nr:riboflavin kinase [Acidimicrobiales bacterium]